MVVVVLENQINKPVKVSYFKYNGEQKTERFIRGIIVSEDEHFIQIVGHTDGKKFTINKRLVNDIVDEGDVDA